MTPKDVSIKSDKDAALKVEGDTVITGNPEKNTVTINSGGGGRPLT